MTRNRMGWLAGREFAIEKGRLLCLKCEKSYVNREQFIKHNCTVKASKPAAKPESFDLKVALDISNEKTTTVTESELKSEQKKGDK